ncbi:MAG: HoxN/HupN/NixA family nickel/cobalt transporter [Gammaproteobacteria bacterium]|nr:HoxN/HupN/NixA family nickel/cobalt transporter [Gammaproteobacteria bacterium]
MNNLLTLLYHIFSDEAGNYQKKVIGLYGVLILFNVVVWIWAIAAFSGNTVLFGAAVLAYTFGLRHAFDADHIASIDSVTRKLMQNNKRPTTVGLYFAIGHSLALVVFVIGIAAFAAWDASNDKINIIDSSASLASTFVSSSFLLIMAALNLTIARSTYQAYKKVRRGGAYSEEDFDMLLNKRGFMARIFRPLFRLVSKSWHMSIVGLLFGLGFDTATEVSLLGIAGAEAARGLSVWSILIFPALFAAGMMLMDTTDSILMVRAYSWAFRNPLRKLHYNLTITIVSALVALIVAGIEVLALVKEQLNLSGQLWEQVSSLSQHWEMIGILVVTLFVASWLVSMLIYKARRFEYAEVRVFTTGDASKNSHD